MNFKNFPFLCIYILSLYLFTLHAHGMCINHEKDALLKLKQGIEIDRCGLMSSWVDNHTKDCCEWDGIVCNNITGHVIKLNLRGKPPTQEGEEYHCLTGKLDASLADLKHLVYLDVSLNDFSPQYSIPKFIGSLTKLEYLNLSRTQFEGQIPCQLRNLSRLTTLDLSVETYNLMKSISLSWLSRLSLLKSIRLKGVRLSEATDWLTSIGNLPLLEEVHLGSCNLPSTFGFPLSFENSTTSLSVFDLSSNFMNISMVFQWLLKLDGTNTHLNYLSLSWNTFEGPLPGDFAKFQALSFLDLSNINLRGSFPHCLLNMHNLSYLYLSGNKLEDPIPESISNMANLIDLDLSNNSFTMLRKALGNLCNLETLDLSINRLTDDLAMILESLTGCTSKSLSSLILSTNQIWGQIPDKIDIFSSLKVLDLHNNRLNGTISQNLGQLSMLHDLQLSGNNFTGTLTQNHFLNLSRLESLGLSSNPKLVVHVNGNWVPPFQLRNIDLGSCRLGPQFPLWLLTQKQYTHLDISNAGISDTIPKSFGSLPSELYYVNMSHNQIYGLLPEFSGHPLNPALDNIELDFGFNRLEGAIPSLPPFFRGSIKLNNNKFNSSTSFLCPQGKLVLYLIDLSHNLLYGELPNCWMKFNQLNILRLNDNYFSGCIPKSFGHLKELTVLHLSNNSFSGEVLELFENLTSLIILDLSHNSFSWGIPPTIGKHLKSLSFLSLRRNKIVGEIPLSMCQISSLRILDLSGNYLCGSIPNCIHNFTAMQNGTDMFPELDYVIHHDSVFGGFHWSVYIDSTLFTWEKKGWIFRENLRLVKAIDLSENNLRGEIPIEIFNLTGLVLLDLSRNNLTGSISPKVGQLVALQVLDLSNNNLFCEIPTSLGDLNFLDFLDLSFNHLSGKISNSTRLQGFNTSTYTGNPELCGPPLPQCPKMQPYDKNGYTNVHGNNYVFQGLYIGMIILGFIL